MASLLQVGLRFMDIQDENERLRKAIRSFERADTEMRRAEATMEQPRLQRAGDRFAMARYRLFLTAKQPSPKCDTETDDAN